MLPEPWLAPTWSWAAVDTPIQFTYEEPTHGRNEGISVTMGMPGVYHNISTWISYDLTFMTSILKVQLRAAENVRVCAANMELCGPFRKVDLAEMRENHGLRFNRCRSDKFIARTRAGTLEHWALLLARGTGSSNVKDARIDVGLIIQPGVTNKSICRRYGYFEQFYWKGDKYQWFADVEFEIKEITIY